MRKLYVVYLSNRNGANVERHYFKAFTLYRILHYVEEYFPTYIIKQVKRLKRIHRKTDIIVEV